MESREVLVGAAGSRGGNAVGADAEILAIRADHDGGRLDGRGGHLVAAASLWHRYGRFWRDHRVADRSWRHVYLGQRAPALAERKPDLDAGVYAYAKAGLGDYLGFLPALGYFFSACLGNTFYWVLIKSTLVTFFPIFGNGGTLAAVVISSIGIWIFHFTVLRGVQQAAAINKVVTVAKVLPIILFILILAVSFKGHLFAANFWGGEGMPASGIFDQVRATMLITTFVFTASRGRASIPAMRRSVPMWVWPRSLALSA